MDFDELQTILSDIKTYAKDRYIPIIRDKSARFLYDYVVKHDCKNVLEIGTAIGYSGSIILSANDCKLTTVEINGESFDKAKDTFARLNYSDRVNMYLMDAKDLLEKLVINKEKFDLIFFRWCKRSVL